MSIPQQLIHSLQHLSGFDETAFLAIHHQNVPPISLRVNPFKDSQQFDNEEVVSWNEHGRYLKTRPNFTLDPLFHAGTYYVQEASSMFLEYALKTLVDFDEDLKVLDLCAAPGGKSTLIASLLSDDSLLVANEVIKTRANVLADNLSKWGTANTFVSNNDPKDFKRLPAFFDVVVIDAPCSGSGLFRKDAGAIAEWSLDNVNLCSQRQQRILADVWDSLKVGGTLIYSTCSYSEAENEQQLDWISEQFSVKSLPILSEKNQLGIIETQSDRYKALGYRFYPDKIKGEGFFIAAFQKTAGVDEPKTRFFREKPSKYYKGEKEIFSKYIADIERFTWIRKDENYYLINEEHRGDFELIQKNLYLRKAGIRLGQLAGKDLIPDHELALSNVLNPKIPQLNLSKEEALRYLRRDVIQPETDLRGWVLVCYEDFALGWAKVLPNRINNYFPKDMRILQEI